jgi:hypothetical protein
MDKWVNKKGFKKAFAPYSEHGTQIWVISSIKKLPAEIVKMATRLADLDFIKYVRVCDETLAASSENYPNRSKVPITNMNHETAIGIQIIYSTEYKIINFFDINSPNKGYGGKMVDAVFKDFSNDWQPAVAMDWSNGFWDRMKEKYRKDEWIL